MQISKRLMSGMVLMYQGEGIGDYDTRTSDLIAIGLKYWYCMNGKVSDSIPNIINKFPRCESTAGHQEGHDDGELVYHTHTIGTGGISHSHSLSYVSSHNHTSISEAILFSSSNRASLWFGSVRTTTIYNTTSDGEHTHNVTSYEGNHSHTLETTGGSATDKNMPKYSGLQFIRRLR